MLYWLVVLVGGLFRLLSPIWVVCISLHLLVLSVYVLMWDGEFRSMEIFGCLGVITY